MKRVQHFQLRLLTDCMLRRTRPLWQLGVESAVKSTDLLTLLLADLYASFSMENAFWPAVTALVLNMESESLRYRRAADSHRF